jgi:hypothetical protein
MKEFSRKAIAPAMNAVVLFFVSTAAAQSPLSSVAEGQFIYLKGEVAQSVQSGADFWLRVNITPGDYGIWRDTIIVTYHAVSPLQERIGEKAIVEFQGWHRGKARYKTVLGAVLELSLVEACLLWDTGEALRFPPPPNCR